MKKILLSSLALVSASQMQAATIVGNTSAYSSPANLSTAGTTDWAYWNDATNSTFTSAAPTNRKSGATAISSIFPVAGGSMVRATTSSTTTSTGFTYGSAGTSPASGTVSNSIGYFNSSLNSNGAGVSLTVTLPTVAIYEVTIWGAMFGASGQTGAFNASLPGAVPASYSNSTATDDGMGNKNSYVYTMTVTPETAGAVLSVNYTLSGTNNGSSHVLINGAAVRVVPEPSAIALLSLGGLLVFRRRR